MAARLVVLLQSLFVFESMQTPVTEEGSVLVAALLNSHEGVELVDGHVVALLAFSQKEEIDMRLCLDLGQSDGSNLLAPGGVLVRPVLRVEDMTDLLLSFICSELVYLVDRHGEGQAVETHVGGIHEVLVFADPLGVNLLMDLMHHAQHGVFEAEVVGVLDVDAAAAVCDARG